MARGLQLWSPFREMERFRREFDDVFNRFLGSRESETTTASSPPIESFIEGNDVVVRADLPGIDPKDVEVTVTGDTLTLRAKREQKTEHKERDFLHREVSYGSYERTLTLPAGVKPDEIKAAYSNGVLELRMPAPQQMAARKVPIQIHSSDEPGAQPSQK